MRLILDTDIGTDVDDALALAFALRHPDIELVAVTTVADDVVKRADIARRLLEIAGRDDIEVAPGVGWKKPPSGRKSWFGHEGEGLDAPRGTYERHGVDVLLDVADDVEVCTVGMQSNIAAALDRDPPFAERLKRLDVMGGGFADRIEDAWPEHNLNVDRQASLRALNAGIPTLYTPIDVTRTAPLLDRHVDALRSGDELCRTLAGAIDIWKRFAKLPGNIAAYLHDPLAVHCAVDHRFVGIETLPVAVVGYEGTVRTVIDEANGRPAEVVRSVDGTAFADLWLETVLR